MAVLDSKLYVYGGAYILNGSRFLNRRVIKVDLAAVNQSSRDAGDALATVNVACSISPGLLSQVPILAAAVHPAREAAHGGSGSLFVLGGSSVDANTKVPGNIQYEARNGFTRHGILAMRLDLVMQGGANSPCRVSRLKLANRTVNELTTQHGTTVLTGGTVLAIASSAKSGAVSPTAWTLASASGLREVPPPQSTASDTTKLSWDSMFGGDPVHLQPLLRDVAVTSRHSSNSGTPGDVTRVVGSTIASLPLMPFARNGVGGVDSLTPGGTDRARAFIELLRAAAGEEPTGELWLFGGDQVITKLRPTPTTFQGNDAPNAKLRRVGAPLPCGELGKARAEAITFGYGAIPA